MGGACYLQTGQVTCHDATRREIDCAGCGQDGEFRRGVPWPGPRFENEGKTVTDRLTGLVWCRNANLAEFPLTWQEALDYVAQMNRRQALGYSDWRLPNRRELRSLISHQAKRPALPEDQPFTNIFNGWYWSSTTATISPAHAWYVNMEGGRMFYGGKDQSFLVWPVRGKGNGVLPATGQTRCYAETGEVISWAGAGQDSELSCGCSWPSPRFQATREEVICRTPLMRWSPFNAAHQLPDFSLSRNISNGGNNRKSITRAILMAAAVRMPMSTLSLKLEIDSTRKPATRVSVVTHRALPTCE
ncbi:MAG: DUF1566 domain-containing protein [Pseudomonadota bacterium]|nr:DUF1566 domain-containing protein [Pseudomonadota bacterium]